MSNSSRILTSIVLFALLIVQISPVISVVIIDKEKLEDRYDPYKGDELKGRTERDYKFPAPPPSGSCDPTQEAQINAAIAAARKMATDSSTALKMKAEEPMSLLSHTIFELLFTRDMLNDVLSTYDGLGNMIDEESTIVIFCNENHHILGGRDTDANTRWHDSTWWGNSDKDGNQGAVMIGREVYLEQDPEAKPRLPRETICQSAPGMLAYTSIGEHELQQQFHIVLCPSFFQDPAEEPIGDTREIDQIVADGLRPFPKNALDNIRPRSSTILHEFMHVWGGPARRSDNTPLTMYAAEGSPQFIYDIEANGRPCYGFTQCQAAKRAYEAEKDAAKKLLIDPIRNADSYVALSLAISLQPRVDSKGQRIQDPPPVCNWALGFVDPDTLEPQKLEQQSRNQP